MNVRMNKCSWEVANERKNREVLKFSCNESKGKKEMTISERERKCSIHDPKKERKKKNTAKGMSPTPATLSNPHSKDSGGVWRDGDSNLSIKLLGSGMLPASMPMPAADKLLLLLLCPKPAIPK